MVRAALMVCNSYYSLKRSLVGPARVDAGASYGFEWSHEKDRCTGRLWIQSSVKYATMLQSLDSGASVDPFDEIINKGAPTQNYTVSFNGGTRREYRALNIL